MFESNTKVTYNKKGLESLFQELKNLASHQVEWGFFEDAVYTSDKNAGTHVATIANMQQEGFSKESYGRRVETPARPFFDDQIRNIQRGRRNPLGARVVKQMEYAVWQVVMQEKAPHRALAPLGETLQVTLSQAITDWTYPENSAWTVDEKGFNDPLIETGFMRDSVSFQIVKNRIEQNA